MMAIIFTLNQEGILIKVKVTDCNNGNALDKNNISDQFMIFFKPDGTELRLQATLVTDPQTPAESFVQYQDATGVTILDLIGNWEFAAEITVIPGNKVQTSERQVFWVK